MPARRRRTLDRNPIRRFQMWDRKLNPDIVAEQLRSVKPIARDKVLSYQVTHEYLIQLVRDVLANYPREAARHHEYMWYAQGIWQCTQKFRGEALLKCAVQKHVHHAVNNLDDQAMREIAARLGVQIPPWETILANYLGASAFLQSIWQQGYQEGYTAGYSQGYAEGYEAGAYRCKPKLTAGFPPQPDPKTFKRIGLSLSVTVA